MNCIIPFSKDIRFKTNISEILSISLEHDYTLNDNELLGNFIITGDYKSHEVSVNKERFEHVLPFSVALTDRIDAETLEFNIEDFTYEVLNNNTLKIDIEYSVRGDTIVEDKIIFERLESEEETTVEELLDEMEEKLGGLEEKKQEEKEEIIEETLVVEDEVRNEVEIVEAPENTESIIVEEPVEEEPIEEVQLQEEKEVEEVVVERDITDTQKETILNSIDMEEDNAFVTYHIHVLKESETVETVCSLYNTTSNLLAEYNDLANVSVGDKIIIPEENE